MKNLVLSSASSLSNSPEKSSTVSLTSNKYFFNEKKKIFWLQFVLSNRENEKENQWKTLKQVSLAFPRLTRIEWVERENVIIVQRFLAFSSLNENFNWTFNNISSVVGNEEVTKVHQKWFTGSRSSHWIHYKLRNKL